jgi:hypothetical protein
VEKWNAKIPRVGKKVLGDFFNVPMGEKKLHRNAVAIASFV